MKGRADRGPPVAALGLLVSVRVATSLAVLAASPGRLIPGFPRYRYDPLVGDAYGYYSCAREIVAVWRRHAAVLGPVVGLEVAALCAVWRATSSRAVRAEASVVALAVVVALLAAFVRFTGAPQFGWPLLLSVPALPLRVAGLTSPGVVFAVGLVLALAANAVTVAATWSISRSAGLGERAALAPAAMVACWPVLVLLTGEAARNGTWQIDLGLSMYTEPVSTALVAVALAIVVERNAARWSVAAGALLGVATLVRLSNAIFAACVLAGLALVGERRRASLVAGGVLPWAPAALLFWPKGYPKLSPPDFPAHPLAWRYAGSAWTDSTLWHPSVLVVLVPLALLGCLTLARRTSLLLWPSVAATAAFYSFYALTPIHPRFLFVVLPPLLVLWVAGLRRVATTIARR